MPTDRIKYLVKANSKLVCHCTCSNALISSPTLVQMDCPWCGCGWLWCCIDCGKPFTFARVELIDATLATLAERNIKAFGWKLTQDSVRDWVEFMHESTKELTLGQEMVYLDGNFVPVDEADFEIEGIHRPHHFSRVPQLDALENRTAIDQLLGSIDYWGSSPEERDDE